MIDLVREICVLHLDDPSMTQQERVVYAVSAAMRDMNWLASVHVKTVEFDIPDSLILKMPADCLDVLKVGIVNCQGVMLTMLENQAIRRVDTGCSCTQTQACDAHSFHNYSGNLPTPFWNQWSELYGLHQQQNFLGYYRWNAQARRIEFASGGIVESGAKLLVEYQTTATAATFAAIPQQYYTLLKFMALRQMFATQDPNRAEYAKRMVQQEIQNIKRVQWPTPTEIVSVLRGSRIGAPKQ